MADGSDDLMALMDPAMAAEPRALYKTLRDTAPVMRVGDGAVVLSSKAHVDEAFRHPEVFSSNWSAIDLGNVRPLIPLQIDPPDHVRYRRLLDPLFAPRAMARLETQIAALVHRLVDRFADRGSCDLVSEFTIPLPSEVFLTMFGLPLEELDTFLGMKNGIIHASGTVEEQAAIRKKAAAEIYDYFEVVLDERAVKPTDDLISGFVTAEIDGERLTRHEILDICFLLMIAGLDTVTASLDCFFAFLAQHPTDRQALADNPALIPAAVEELLRYESPVSGVPRIAVADTELNGTPIKAGDHIMIILGAANTDEAEFDAADVVDFGRETNRHLAFGGGVHRCLGSHLARQELRVALREFHTRIPSYRLAEGAELAFTPGIRSLDRLPLEFPL